MGTRSMTPLKLSPNPMGSCSAMGLACSVFSMSSSARRKDARSLSSLLTQASSGSTRSTAISQCASVWCLTPETADTISNPPSQTAIERSASVRKSENPGASSRLRSVPSCSAKVMCVATVKFRLVSSGSTSRWLVEPSLEARAGASWRRSASVSAVFPAPSWAMMATLRMVLGSSMRWSPGARCRTHINPHKSICLAAAAAFCWIASPALAQTVPPTAGAVPPAHSFALDDDGTSLDSNPGGLGFASGLELNYLHAGGHGSAATQADSFLMTGGTGFLTLGLGWDWVKHAPCSEPGILCQGAGPAPVWSTRRSSQGIGLKLGQLGIGATHHGFNGGEVHGFNSWDFGLLVRPFNWLSVGGAALDATRENGLPRRWQLSLGLRPIGETTEL